MVLEFESKSYNSAFTRFYYAIFKSGYIANRFHYKINLNYTIGTIIESILIVFILLTNYTDYKNPNIRIDGNIFSSNITKPLNYTNFDTDLSFFVNFLNPFYHLSKDSIYIVYVVLIIIFILKIVEFLYFCVSGVNIINANNRQKLLYTIWANIDLFMRTCGEIIFLILCLIPFSCDNNTSNTITTNSVLTNITNSTTASVLNTLNNTINSTITIVSNSTSNTTSTSTNSTGNSTKYNIQLDMVCFTGNHIPYLIIAGLLLLFLLFNFIFSLYFYDPCDVISEENYGVSDHFNKDLLWLLIKLDLVLLNLFDPTVDQGELIKICIFIGLNILSLFFTYKKLVKSDNYIQEIGIIKEGFLLSVSVFTLSYTFTNIKISIMVFILMILISFMVGNFIKIAFFSYKFSGIYARVSTN
jgi:hypothetical protein